MSTETPRAAGPQTPGAPSTRGRVIEPAPLDDTPGAGDGGGQGEGDGDGEGEGELDDGNKLKRKRQPRNSACQACANLKMKCVPSGNAGVCERCNRMSRECIPAVPKPRKKRNTLGAAGDDDDDDGQPQQPPSRTASQPQMLAGQSLPQPERPSDPASSSSPSRLRGRQQQAPPRPSRANLNTSNGSAAKDSLLNRSDLSLKGTRSFTSLLEHGLGLREPFAASPDLLQGIDYSTVLGSLDVFRQMTHHLPFVEVPPSTDPEQLAAQRPFLTLAITAVTAGSSPANQDRFSTAFRIAVARETLLEAGCSLDLMQGLLVFVGFHHHCLPKHQVYQKLHLLAGMAVDLGLQSRSTRSGPPRNAVDLEKDRAFLGCYYLCSGLSYLSLKKPCPLRWSSALRNCAETVTQFGTLPSDRTMVPALELMYAVEETANMIEASIQGASTIAPNMMDVHMRTVKYRFAALKREHPSLSTLPIFGAAMIHFSIGLLKLSSSPDPSNLIQSACLIKEYLDELLHHPPAAMHRMNIVNWSNLLEMLVHMAFLSKPNALSHGWEVGALASLLQPEVMLDAVCNHMAAAPSNDPSALRHDGLLYSLRSKCQIIKQLIAREMEDVHHGRSQGPGGAGELPVPIDQLVGRVEQLGYSVLDNNFWISLS